MTQEEILHIFVEVANGRGHHGSFLRAFASAVAHADDANIRILTPSAEVLIKKYGLEKYLDTFLGEEATA
jgi:hypothetical protein